MNEKQLEFLKMKIVDMQSHLDDQISKKKAIVARYTEEINATKKRMSNYAMAIKMAHLEYAGEVMDAIEWEDFASMQ